MFSYEEKNLILGVKFSRGHSAVITITTTGFYMHLRSPKNNCRVLDNIHRDL